MKKIVCTTFASLFLFAVLVPCVSVLASSSSVSYSFVMEKRNVDGWKNGHSFSLPAGNASISGYISSEPIDITATADPYVVHYSLNKKGFLGLFTTGYGTVTGPAFGYFSGSFDSVPAGDRYYLDIWKSAVDGWRNTGYGEVIVTY